MLNQIKWNTTLNEQVGRQAGAGSVRGRIAEGKRRMIKYLPPPLPPLLTFLRGSNAMQSKQDVDTRKTVRVLSEETKRAIHTYHCGSTILAPNALTTTQPNLLTDDTHACPEKCLVWYFTH